MCFQAGLGTGCGILRNQISVAVFLNRNDQVVICNLNLAGVKILITYRAMIVCPQAGFGAGCRLGSDPVTVGMTYSRNLLGLGVTAIGTGVEDLALVLAVGSGNFHAIVPLVRVEQIQLCANIFNADIVVHTVIPQRILFTKILVIILKRILLSQNIIVILERILLAQEVLTLGNTVIVAAVAIYLQEGAQGAAIAVNTQLPQHCGAQLNSNLEAQHIIIHRSKDLSLCFIGQCQGIHHIGEEVLVSYHLVPGSNDLGSGQGVVNLLQLLHRIFCIVGIQGAYHSIPNFRIAIGKDHGGHQYILGVIAQVDHHFTGKITGDEQCLILQTGKYVDGDIHSYIVLDDVFQSLSQLQKFQTHIANDHNGQRAGLCICRVSTDVHGVVRLAVIVDLFSSNIVGCYQGICLVNNAIATIFKCFVQSIIIGESIHDLLCNILQVFLGNPALQGIDDCLFLAVVSNHSHDVINLDVKYLLAIQVEAGINVVIQRQLHSCIQSNAQQALSVDHAKQIIIICIQCQRQVICTVIHYSEQLVMYSTVCFLHIAVRQQAGNISMIGTAENRCAGYSACYSTNRCYTALVSAVKDDHSVGTGNVAVYGLAVQVNQHRSFQCLILNADGIAIQIQVSSDIIQQNDQICTFCDSRQLSSSCQTGLIGNAVCCHIYKQGSIICVHIFNMTGQININTCVVFCNNLGQVDIAGSALVINIVIERDLNQIQEFLHPDVLQGDIYALIIVDDLFTIVGVGDHFIDHLSLIGIDAVKDFFICTFDLVYANTANQHICCVHNGIPFCGILIQHGIDQLNQECQSNLRIQLIYMAQIDLAGCNQCCNICCIYRLRHSQVCNCLIVFEGQFQILINQGDPASQCLHISLCAIRGEVEISCQGFAILFKVSGTVHNFCTQIIIADVGQHCSIFQFHMLQCAIFINLFQNGVCACAAVEQRINKRLDIIVTFAIEHMIVEADMVVTAQEHTCTNFGKAVHEICIIHAENHSILTICILGNNACTFHMVYEVNQHILLQLQQFLLFVDLNTGKLNGAINQALELLNTQLISTGANKQVTDHVVVTHTLFGMSRQIQVHIVVVNNTYDYIGTSCLDFILVEIPGVVKGKIHACQRSICKIVTNSEEFFILRSNIMSSLDFFCPSQQLSLCQCCACGFYKIFGIGHAAVSNVNLYIGISQAGNMDVLLPVKGCGHAAIQCRLCCIHQIQQCAEVSVCHIDLIVIDSNIFHNICSSIQSFFNLFKQAMGCILNKFHKGRIVHQNLKQIIQQTNLCLISLFVSVVVVHTAVGVQFHSIVQCDMSVYRNHLIQCLTGCNCLIAKIVSCL